MLSHASNVVAHSLIPFIKATRIRSMGADIWSAAIGANTLKTVHLSAQAALDAAVTAMFDAEHTAILQTEFERAMTTGDVSLASFIAGEQAMRLFDQLESRAA